MPAFGETLRAAALLACISVWLSIPAGSHAQTSPETCPPPASPPAPAVAPSASTLAPPVRHVVACVGSQTIDGALFRHWATVARRAESRAQRHSARHVSALIDEVMGFLVSSDWVIGEAQDLNVHVSETQVRRMFDRIRHEQFPKSGEFRAFLQSTGQTVADLLFRVRLSLLSGRIQSAIVAGKKGAVAEEALTHFVTEFKSKWRTQTYCQPAFAVSDCGHVQSVL